MTVSSIKIIKRRELLTANTMALSIDDARGIAEYRAFEPIANLYAVRVSNLAALEVMMTINEAIRQQLTDRREALMVCSQKEFEN